MSDINFHQRLDEAMNPPTMAMLLNRWAIKPDPADLNKPDSTGSVEGALDDVDVFVGGARGQCKGVDAKDIVMRDQHGNDVAEKLEAAFQGNMGLWVAHSPGWQEHHDFEDFEGHLSTRPSLVGPECVVWVDSPYEGRGGPYYRGAWYHPGKGMWIDE